MKRRALLSILAAAAVVIAVAAGLSAPKTPAEPSPSSALEATPPAPTEAIRRPKPDIKPIPPPPPVVIAVAGDVLTGERIGPRIAAGE
ncbi:MAG: hypothetical protein LBC28_01545, partial [Oscillospiraceae bacterium]|nr:hypothetical protein [Oscillospiraceae bacterium]